jgi:hypothetical protein
MLSRRNFPITAMICLLLSPAMALAAGGSMSDTVLDQGSVTVKSGGGNVCVAGALVEAWSEGAWYPAVVLDPLRDGRCFVHYENYGSDDDEALAPKHVRARR